MAMSYTTLIGAKSVDGSIRAWLNNATIPATTVLEEAEAEIYRSLRAVEMRRPGAVGLGSGSNVFDLPTRTIMIEPPVVIYGTAGTGKLGTLMQVDAATLQQHQDYEPTYSVLGTTTTTSEQIIEGLPRRYALIGTASAYMDRTTDDGYNLRFHYWERPSALSSSNETNFLTSRFPRLLRAACLVGANEWLKDDQEKVYWQNEMAKQIALANAEAEAILRRDLDAFVTTR